MHTLPTLDTSGVLIAVLAVAIALLAAILYRRYPLHLIYKSKTNLETMLDAIGDPLAVIDTTYIVKRANKAYISLVGSTFAGTVGAKCHLLLRKRQTPCEDCRLEQSLKTHTPQGVERSPHPSGTGAVSFNFSPVVDSSYASIRPCVIEHIRDITTLEKLKNDLVKKNRSLAHTMRTLKMAQQNIHDELKLARQIQQGILPKSAPDFEGAKIDLTYHPVADVGGDIYDFIRFSETRLGIFIGDASGHGLSSAFVGTISKMSLFNHSKAEVPPEQLLASINNDLLTNIHSAHYLTCFFGILDIEKNELTYSRAGHPHPVVVRKSGEVFALKSTGTFLGIVENAVFDQGRFSLERGDRIFLFTDGIYEVLNRYEKDSEVLGYDRFQAMLAQCNQFSFGKLLSGIQHQLTKFTYEDDYTLIAIEITRDRMIPDAVVSGAGT